MTTRALLAAVSLLLLLGEGCAAGGADGAGAASSPDMREPAAYEGGRVALWQPVAIASPMFESHAAFDPWTNDLYFVRSTPSFKGWRLMVSRCGAAGWSEPTPPDFAGDGVEADPSFSIGGRHLYFISTRTTDGVRRADLDVWRVLRDVSGRWGVPERLPVPVNSEGQEWFPRWSADGWLYFGSSRQGGYGQTDIWRGRVDIRGAWQVENVGTAVNTPDHEYEALPAPDGQRLIIVTATGVYESRRRDGRWQPRTRLGAAINENSSEIGPLFSPTGRSLLFARDTKTAASGEFVLWQEDPPENWPPSCSGVHP